MSSRQVTSKRAAIWLLDIVVRSMGIAGVMCFGLLVALVLDPATASRAVWALLCILGISVGLTLLIEALEHIENAIRRKPAT